MAKKYVIEAESKQLLGCKQRHASLIGRAIAFSLIAFDAGGDEVVRSAFAALGTRENVIQRQLFSMLGFAAILTAIAVADVDPCTFHRRFAVGTADVDVMTQPNNGRHGKGRRGRMQQIIAVIFLNKYRTAKPQTNSTSDTHGAEWLVRKVQQ